MRGGMEKCTYCGQRLEGAKIKQKQQQKQKTLAAGLPSTAVGVDRAVDLRIPTNSVKVACQEACPTAAISFGNLLDRESKIVKAKGNQLDSIARMFVSDEEWNNFKVEGSGRNYDLRNLSLIHV